MNLKDLRSEHRVIDLFVELVQIPSPSLKEENLAKCILNILQTYNILGGQDKYGNILAKIPASINCKNVEPLLLSSHMDVVGGSEEVNVRISTDGKFIETDKTRTLGADNKAGIASILDLAIELNSLSSTAEHGPLEITFTRDEEMGMTGIKNLDTAKLKAKYAIIADGERLGEHDSEGAGFTNVYIKVSKGKGGHSGMNISDKTRLNAIKVLSELDSKIPQGVYKQDERGVVTSINAGGSIGGSTGVAISEIIKNIHLLGKQNKPIPEKYDVTEVMNTICLESAVNIINTQAQQSYSIRSSDPESEKELITLISNEVEQLNKKYKNLIKIDLTVKTHLKPFISHPDNILSKAVFEAGLKNNLNSAPGVFHAGAETHILANDKTNDNNEKFIPVLVGIANLENLHSPDEKIEWESLVKGRKFLEDIVTSFANQQKRK